MKKIISLLILAVFVNPLIFINAQAKTNPVKFDEIKILLQNGNDTDQRSVTVEFLEESLTIKSEKGAIDKTFKYSDIKRAEYSYSKNPRWKTGIGLGAASIIFPPLLLVAIPLGFTKHKRHWVTIQTENDYAVLKLSKSNRKMFMPTFETKTGVTIEAAGEDK
jgi:hypothetical protein